MAQYSIVYKKSVKKELRKLPVRILRLVDNEIQALRSDPLPAGTVKIQGSHSSYRIRVGDYRVIYEIKGDVLVIEIIKIGHRKDVYR